MNNSITIQKVIAFVLLSIFTLSITPKKYLHDLASDHTDYYGVEHGDNAVVSNAGFNCHCEDLVVSTPFIEVSFLDIQVRESEYKTSPTLIYQYLYYNSQPTKELRGPPGLS